MHRHVIVLVRVSVRTCVGTRRVRSRLLGGVLSSSDVLGVFCCESILLVSLTVLLESVLNLSSDWDRLQVSVLVCDVAVLVHNCSVEALVTPSSQEAAAPLGDDSVVSIFMLGISQ